MTRLGGMPPAVLERNADVWDSLRTLGAPTVSELAEHTGRPPRAVGEALDQLRSQGLAEWAGWWGTRARRWAAVRPSAATPRVISAMDAAEGG